MQNNLLGLNDLAVKYLTRKEYADFLTVMAAIRDRSKADLEQRNPAEPELVTFEKKYSHDIELNMEVKIIRNNHKGESVELKSYHQVPILIKVPLGDDPEEKFQSIYQSILSHGSKE